MDRSGPAMLKHLLMDQTAQLQMIDLFVTPWRFINACMVSLTVYLVRMTQQTTPGSFAVPILRN